MQNLFFLSDVLLRNNIVVFLNFFPTISSVALLSFSYAVLSRSTVRRVTPQIPAGDGIFIPILFVFLKLPFN